MQFAITFERITPESAEHGEMSDSGFVYEKISLREAFQYLPSGAYCEANCSHHEAASWITFYDTEEDFRTGETENMSLHFPRHMTAASRARVCRLFKVYGV